MSKQIEQDPKDYYGIPGTKLEVIDVLQAMAVRFDDPWEFFLWASAMQYMFRYMSKGTPMTDVRKATTYLRWLIANAEDGEIEK